MTVTQKRVPATTALKRNPTSKVAMIFAAYEGVRQVYSHTREYYQQHFEYTVTVSERDILYDEVHNWLIEVTPDERHRALTVGSGHHSKNTNDSPVFAESDPAAVELKKPLIIRFNDNSSRKLSIGKHQVIVSVVVPEMQEGDNQYRERTPSKIVFVTRSYEGQQAVIQQLDILNNSRRGSRKAVLKMVGTWGNWRTRSDLPPRTLPSVSIPDIQKNRIVEDLKTFLSAEEQYNRLAIPWHRGYMFHGPPGTGKTSIVKALANEFNLDLWYISLSDLNTEASLLGLLSDVGPRSLLLLEDIDTAKITHDRDNSDSGKISMSSLLNTLDGVATPHGLITMMTTNRFDILDPALTRAGRMDVIEEIGYPQKSTIEGMYRHFYNKALVWPKNTNKADILFDGVSTAQIAELFKRYMLDPKSAQVALMELLQIDNGSVRRIKPVSSERE